ncbi:unnamed protein product, partial [Discosporangium mesarthrocarpum]
MSVEADPELGKDADERIAVVDEATNEIVGSARRAEMRRDNLPHRATYVFLRVRGGSPNNPRMWVQKRTMTKDYCPGYIDPTAGGVVGAGEDYDINAQRELEEEMGVVAKVATRDSLGSGHGIKEMGGEEEAMLRHCFNFHYKDARTNVWGGAFDC